MKSNIAYMKMHHTMLSWSWKISCLLVNFLKGSCSQLWLHIRISLGDLKTQYSPMALTGVWCLDASKILVVTYICSDRHVFYDLFLCHWNDSYFCQLSNWIVYKLSCLILGLCMQVSVLIPHRGQNWAHTLSLPNCDVLLCLLRYSLFQAWVEYLSS